MADRRTKTGLRRPRAARQPGAVRQTTQGRRVQESVQNCEWVWRLGEPAADFYRRCGELEAVPPNPRVQVRDITSLLMCPDLGSMEAEIHAVGESAGHPDAALGAPLCENRRRSRRAVRTVPQVRARRERRRRGRNRRLARVLRKRTETPQSRRQTRLRRRR